MTRSGDELAANAGQPCWKGRIRGRVLALEEAYGEYRLEVHDMELDDKTREAFKKVLNGSPMYRHMQMEVQDAGEGHSRMTLNARKELHSPYGMLHGGAVASLMDSACSIALGTLLEPGEMGVTVDFRINYISNLKEGTLVCESRVIHRGKQTGVTEAEIKDEAGNLIAVGMSTHLVCAPGDVKMAGYPEPPPGFALPTSAPGQ
jgi:uncharacterized protein (TIGR00369 family)